LVSVWKRIPANPKTLDFTGVFGFVLIILYGEGNKLIALVDVGHHDILKQF